MKDPDTSVPAPAHLASTRLLEPGSHLKARRNPGPGGLLDIRVLPLDPLPPHPRHHAVTAVGASIATEFDAREIADPDAAPPGTVLISYQQAHPLGGQDGLVAVTVLLAVAGQGQPDAVAVWLELGAAWPEIVRPSVVFAARHHARGTR